jgi:hypothetical protein
MSVRALMMAVLLVGGGFGWMVHRARVQREAVAAIEAVGGDCTYDWQEPIWRPGSDGLLHETYADGPPWPAWVERTVGLDFLYRVTSVVLFFDPDKVDDSVLEQVGRLDGLESLNCEGCSSITDSGLTRLRGLRRLKTLSLAGTGVKGPGLIHLSGMGRLEYFDLRATFPKDADLAPLAHLTSLVGLALSGKNLTDAALAHLAGLVHLESLVIDDGRFTGSGLYYLSGLRRLDTLKLRRSRVESLAGLAGLSAIEVLEFDGCPIDDTGLAPVAGMTRLRDLSLCGTRVTDAGMSHLAGLNSLSDLNLANTQVSNAGMATLAARKGKLLPNVYRTRVTPEVIQEWDRAFKTTHSPSPTVSDRE